MSERRGTKALELWCRRMTEGYPGVKIDNMTTSWRDGLAFCAMIHHFRPDLIEFEKLNKSDVYYNNSLAFSTAEKYLGIPALLDADDMASYEVPDRLSILTYLSQFYQVFAAQDAHNRLKRTSSSASDKTQITKSSGPPSKMAHVVGVPKRDPCRKCQLPVFLAERLMVGKKVYHRTCLKCARCGYQLTPGSFYETEIDDQYCCETCPDEEEVTTEMQMDLETKAKSSLVAEYTDVELRNKFERETNMLSSPTRSVRSSIKERLAFFESQRDDEKINTNLLQKSLSDEEKSKSLQRVESSVGHATASYKPNKALTNFLNNTANDEEDDLSESSSSIQNLKMETSDFEDDDTDDLTNVSIPPELPKSLPPLDEHSVDKKSYEIQKRFTSSAQLVLGSTSVVKNKVTEISDEQQNIVEEFVKENQTSELQLNLPSCVRIDKTNNNNSVINEEQISDESHKSENNAEQPTEKAVQVYQSEVDNNLEFSETNDNDCITKDKLTDELFMKCIDETTIQELGDSKDIDRNSKSLNPLENESLENINPVIEKKVFENEVIELRTKSEEKERNNVSLSPEDTETTQTLSVVSARLQKFQVITCNKKDLEDLPSNVQENYVDNETMEICRKTSAQVNNMESGTENFNTKVNDNKVPLTMETKDNANLDSELENNKEYLEGSCNNDNKNDIQIPHKSIIKTTIEEYPEDLNPFKSDEEDNVGVNNNSNEDVMGRATRTSTKKDNLNPFDSSDDDVELDKFQNSRTSTNSMAKIPPPRPPPPRISRNPFGSEDEDDIATKNFQRQSSLTKSQSKKTPVPTPRSIISQSQNPTPEPTPRLSTKINNTCTSSTNATHNNASLPTLQNSSEYYGSAHSLHSSNATPYNNLLRNSDVRSSNNSLNLSAGGTIRSRKSRRAPQPPAPVKELFPSNETINSSSKTSTPSSSIIGTPKSGRKKRPAPAPPKPARLESAQGPRINSDTFDTQPKNLNSYPLQSELDSKLSDEEKALLEGKTLQSSHSNESDLTLSPSSKGHFKRLIPLDKELLEEHGSVQYSKGEISQCDDLKQQNQEKSSVVEEDEMNVVFRRVLIPQNLETPTHEHNPLEDLTKSPSVGERQLEKIKDNKEANNRNRQSQISVTSSGADENDPIFNKSAHGKWKRRKGPAPALPIPPRKVLQMLPLQEIKHELEIIEVQQQGLEKQGVVLEKMIRDRCEGENGEPIKTSGSSGNEDSSTETGKENSKEVENLILQLFELVNEKNELFRRQAELMYLRRQHRLEQEQADLEYEIRILMAQPERNKTDSDKAREEALIERLVEVVKLRNEVIECLEMDRIREAEEDQSIKQRLESHIAKRENDSSTKKTLTKLSKKEKKKQKEAKKLNKSKKLDADKDTDESEFNLDKQKSKKKKKLLIF